MSSITFTAGALIRREIRRVFQQRGYDFTEEKGLLDSQFVVRGDARQLTVIRTALNATFGE